MKKPEWAPHHIGAKVGCISVSIIRDYRIRSGRNYLEQANISPGVSPRWPERKNERGGGEGEGEGEGGKSHQWPRFSLATRISFYPPRTRLFA